ncbi:MAG: helix-turn-helix domain-containing protein [Rhodobacteraceae bacterium]|nr:helix-turn-helix domain-containing protein [Paracoccaceae bacterium]
MDKRIVSDQFRVRLQDLHQRSGLRQAGFAAQIGIDRSALSQLLTGANARLPRAETLISIAQTCQVSLDWLLGLSLDEGISSAPREALEVAQGQDRSLLAQWHAEASGAKIRYVPAGLPDQLCTDAVMQVNTANRNPVAGMEPPKEFLLNSNRAPESDIECCMPVQTLTGFAAGQGIWSGLSQQQRQAQLRHMAAQLQGFYPGFRLFLFDGQQRFSMPYTIFGYTRVAIYAGEIYLLVSAKQTIQTLVAHFDAHIRGASLQAHEVASFVDDLKVT